MCKLLFLLAVRLHLPCQLVKTEVLISLKGSSGFLLFYLLSCHSLGMTLVIPPHPKLCHNLMRWHFYISKVALRDTFQGGSSWCWFLIPLSVFGGLLASVEFQREDVGTPPSLLHPNSAARHSRIKRPRAQPPVFEV